MNSNSELSWVERTEAAIADDPHLNFETRDGRRVLVRSATGPGNTLDYSVNWQRDELPTVLFARDENGFRIEISVGAATGTPCPTQILIKPLSEGEALTSSAIASVNLSKLLIEVNEQMRAPYLRYQLQRDGNTNWSDPFITVPKPGRKGRPDIEYAIWADRYVEANDRSNGKPIALLVDEHPGYSADSLRAILHKARKRGLLSDSPKGRAGGHLLPKATELLSRHGLSITSKGN